MKIMSPTEIAEMLASYLENHAADDVDATDDSELAVALDLHGIAVASCNDDDGSFFLHFAGKRFIVAVTEA